MFNVVSLIVGITLVLSIVSATSLPGTYAETSNTRKEAPLVFGTGGLIDGDHVVQGKELKANWRGGAELKGDNSFSVGFYPSYLSDNPKSAKYYASPHEVLEEIIPDMRPVTSAVFIQMEAVYKDQSGNLSRQQLTKVIPVLAIHVSDREINAVYDGTYEMPTRANEELYLISIKISWLRVFQDNNGNWYYQWIEGSKDALNLSNAFKPDETSATAELVVYYPIPERLTSPESFGFDYVKWIKEQTLGSFGFEKILVGLGRFAHPPSMLADSEGSLHVIWSADEQYEKLAMVSPIYTHGLWYAKVDANSNVVIAPTKLARGSIGTSPAAAVHGDRLHIIWSDARNYNETNGTFNIVLYYMQLNRNGSVLINEKQISNAAKQPDYPLVVADSKGNVHLVWMDSRDVYQRVVGTRPGCVEESGFRLWSFELYKGEGCEIIESGGAVEIYYKKLDQQGNTIVDDRRITSMESLGHSIRYPVKLLVDESDKLHLFQMNLVHPSDYSRQIYYTGLDSNGDKIVQDKPVTEIYDYDAWATDVQMDSEGNFYLARMDHREGELHTVSYLMKVSKNLDVIYEKLISNDRESIDAGWPNLAVDRDNNVHVIWTETWISGEKPPADYKSGAYYMKIDQKEKVLQVPMVISDSGGYMDMVVRESQVYVLSEVGLTGVTITAVPEFPTVLTILVSSIVGSIVISRLFLSRGR